MRNTIVAILLISALWLFVGCNVKCVTGQENPLKIWWENENGSYEVLKIVDENTGVNYVVVSNNSNADVAICPRYNADGSLYVGK